MLTTTRWSRRLACAAMTTLLALPAAAQDLKGPVTLVVGYPPGGSADAGARILADKLPALIGQPVIVDNRAGAGGQIAARCVKDAPANGTVLFFTNGHTVVTVPQVLKAPGFDTVADLRPVAPFAGFELALAVHPKTGANTLKELVQWFGRTPSERSVAVPAPGSTPEFIVGRLAQLLKLDVQPVAYRGAAPAVQDLLGGQVPAAVLPVADVLPYWKAGRVRVVAVTHATPLLPGVAPFGELGLAEVAAADFLAVYAPAGLPEALAQRFNAAIRQVLAQPDVLEKLHAQALQPQPGSAQDLAQRQKDASTTVRALIKAVGYQPQ